METLTCQWFDSTWTKIDRPSFGAPIPQNTVTVCTHRYQIAHGKAPRGRGGWMFEVGGGSSPMILQVMGGHLLRDARRAAVAEAAAAGVHVIHVAS